MPAALCSSLLNASGSATAVTRAVHTRARVCVFIAPQVLIHPEVHAERACLLASAGGGEASGSMSRGASIPHAGSTASIPHVGSTAALHPVPEHAASAALPEEWAIGMPHGASAVHSGHGSSSNDASRRSTGNGHVALQPAAASAHAYTNPLWSDDSSLPAGPHAAPDAPALPAAAAAAAAAPSGSRQAPT